MATDQVKQDNQTRAQRAKKAHEEASKRRADKESALKSAYRAGDGEAIISDLMEKIAGFIAVNNKVAQDGVGARPTGYKLEDGTPEVENIYLTPEQRASYLDQSKGQQAVLDYIERKLYDRDPNTGALIKRSLHEVFKEEDAPAEDAPVEGETAAEETQSEEEPKAE